MIQTLNLQQYWNASISGVFALYSEKYRRVYLGYSSNVSNAVTGIITQIKGKSFYLTQMQDDFDTLQCVILEVTNDMEHMKFLAQYHADDYRNKGYELYRTRPFVRYKLRTTIETDPTVKSSNQPKYVSIVRKVNSRNDSVIVGIFDTHDEANEFKAYVGNETSFPCIALNHRTRKYYMRKM